MRSFGSHEISLKSFNLEKKFLDNCKRLTKGGSSYNLQFHLTTAGQNNRQL